MEKSLGSFDDTAAAVEKMSDCQCFSDACWFPGFFARGFIRDHLHTAVSKRVDIFPSAAAPKHLRRIQRQI